MVILIVEDELSIRRALELLLKGEHDVILCADGATALQELEKTSVDLVITDFQMPNISGLEVIRKGKQISPATSFVLMTAYGSIHQAVEAVQLGAEDYFTKPFDVTDIEHRIRKIEELRSYKLEKSATVEPQLLAKRLIGSSNTVREMQRFVASAATSTAPALIEGPIGTGKKYIARLIHDSSPRAIYPFFSVDCAGQDPATLEAELFGVERSASPNQKQHSGKFELARGGTIYLDSITELTDGLQAKLLKLIDEKVFHRVGGTREFRSNARIIASSRTFLKGLVEKGAFREDLYYHLNILRIEIPPLAQRPADIPLLIRHHWEKLQKEMRFQADLTDAIVERLSRYPYPGNVRELENVLERLAVSGATSRRIDTDRLPDEYRESQTADHSVDDALADMVVERLKNPINALNKSLSKHGITVTQKKAA